MTDIAAAFERAGLPTASIAFAAACHDLALLALNRQPDPERAVAVALGMMSGNAEFRARLKEFLAEVARQRPGKPKSDGEAHPTIGALVLTDGVARPSDPNGDAADQRPDGTDDAQTPGVPASPLLSDGGDQTRCGRDAQKLAFPPSESRLRAMAKAHDTTARAISKFDFFITERQGSRTPIEQIEVSRLESLCMMTGRRTMASMVENLTLRALLRRMPAYSPDGSRLEDVFGAPEIRDAIESARSSVADMLAMPKEHQLEARA